MRIRKSPGSGQDRVEMQMTPMIDIVFQLLTFFLFSFKIVPQEGDFNIKMPLAAPSAGVALEPVQPILVKLTAGPDGRLARLQMGERALPNFAALHKQVMEIVGTDTGPGSMADTTEVELDCDYNLRYEYVIEAITAISGYMDPSGHIVKLIDKIKFAPPKAPS